ncbi:POTE ankyrin domain family member A-like isoform X1 [Macaca thibetana thibetana]|uniref:POTE ankyrin domain family member A-like isoform X1 n=1 Tax=Macaca thibetana thibetana TaxID=257877 RepID=UPI0021BCAA4B|nr:POTE ankyrin domain family member A-like isoform X1 [Macaca thibetana thibetana]XP_050623050.1 POTE ankyrin domain family member A-like isoform X1 [Macaca thibetana thibetana]
MHSIGGSRGWEKQMGTEVSQKPTTSALKTSGFGSGVGRWCCRCFPCCGSCSQDGAGGGVEHCDSAFLEPGYDVCPEDLDDLHRAAWWGTVPRVELILMLRDPGLDKRDKKKRTALHLACANGHPEVVKLLLHRNCQLHVLDGEKRTALIKAVQCQKEECANILLEHGADPNIPDVYGNTTLHYAIYNEDKSMTKILLSYGANIESENKGGLTPFLLAVLEQKQQMVEFLVKKKANLNAVDNFKRTALILAVCCGSEIMVSILLQLNIDVFSQDIYGRTAEDYAVSRHYIKICQQLSDYKEKNIPRNTSQNSDLEGTSYKIVCLAEGTSNDVVAEGAASVKVDGRSEDSAVRFSGKQTIDYLLPTSNYEDIDSDIKDGPIKPANGQRQNDTGVIASAPQEYTNNDSLIFVDKNNRSDTTATSGSGQDRNMESLLDSEDGAAKPANGKRQNGTDIIERTP